MQHYDYENIFFAGCDGFEKVLAKITMNIIDLKRKELAKAEGLLHAIVVDHIDLTPQERIWIWTGGEAAFKSQKRSLPDGACVPNANSGAVSKEQPNL